MPNRRTRNTSTRRPSRPGIPALPMLLAVALRLPAADGGCSPAPDRRPPPPRNVLLITIDTLRADALGAYGNASAATPWLDRLAAGGVRFSTARAHNVLTLPSHANILTGRLPPDHGVRDNAGFRLAAGEDTLATRLAARGFATGAFISAFPLDSRFGLSRGFDVYDDAFVDAAPRPAFLEQERAGIETGRGRAPLAAGAQGATANRGSGWVHLYEPHYPYAPPEPFATRFSRDPYAGEVAATDAALGPLLQPILDARRGDRHAGRPHLRSRRVARGPRRSHARHLCVRSDAQGAAHPLLSAAARSRASSTRRLRTSTSCRPSWQRSVSRRRRPARPQPGRIWRAPPAAAAVTYFEALSGSLNRGWAPLAGVVSNGIKFIDLPIPELYDLRVDPGERATSPTTRPQEVADRRGSCGRSRISRFGGSTRRRR